MIYDCIMFNDELDLLELRFQQHDLFVDRFVIIEATRTYSGWSKPLYFADNHQRFSPWRSRTHHITLDMPFDSNAGWAYEHAQRDMLRGFAFKPDDIIIYTDTDEILRRGVVDSFRRQYLDIVSLQMMLCFYYLNVRVKKAELVGSTYHTATCFKSKWHMGKILRAALLPSFAHLYQIREHQLWANAPDMLFDAGWHFSNLGTPERIYQKLMAISHCNDPEFAGLSVEVIAERKRKLIDVLGRPGVEFEVFDDLPDPVRQDPETYGEYLYTP